MRDTTRAWIESMISQFLVQFKLEMIRETFSGPWTRTQLLRRLILTVACNLTVVSAVPCRRVVVVAVAAQKHQTKGKIGGLANGSPHPSDWRAE